MLIFSGRHYQSFHSFTALGYSINSKQSSYSRANPWFSLSNNHFWCECFWHHTQESCQNIILQRTMPELIIPRHYFLSMIPQQLMIKINIYEQYQQTTGFIPRLINNTNPLSIGVIVVENFCLILFLMNSIKLVNSPQRWRQTRNRVCFHLGCELTLA